MSPIKARNTFVVVMGLSASLFSSHALAEDLCAPIQQRVNQAYQERINASKPTTSAGEFVQANYDIKGILTQNVTGNFAKLLSLDFSSIANNIVNSAMSQIGKKAVTTAANHPAPVLYAPIQPTSPEPAAPTGPYSWAKSKITNLFGN